VERRSLRQDPRLGAFPVLPFPCADLQLLGDARSASTGWKPETAITAKSTTPDSRQRPQQGLLPTATAKARPAASLSLALPLCERRNPVHRPSSLRTHSVRPRLALCGASSLLACEAPSRERWGAVTSWVLRTSSGGRDVIAGKGFLAPLPARDVQSRRYLAACPSPSSFLTRSRCTGAASEERSELTIGQPSRWRQPQEDKHS